MFSKLIKASIIVFVFMAAQSALVYAAYDSQAYVRVGLKANYSNAANITINENNINISYSYGGNTAFTLNSSNGFTVSSPARNYVKVGSFPSFYDAYNYINSNTSILSMAPAYNSFGEYYVYAFGFGNETDVSTWANTIGGVVTSSANTIEISAGGKTVAIFDGVSPVVSTSNKIISLGNKNYRDNIEFKKASGSTITVISLIDKEYYLYGVVASEVYPSWHEESLKAQAVAARTYMQRKIESNTHQSEGYDLCDTVHCQAYGGYDKEADSTTKAVESTRGILAYYDNKPIDAVYSSSSGGYTESSEDAWAEEVPYLRAVKEINEYDGKKWTRNFTLSDFDKILSSRNENIGTTKSITVTYNDSGRVSDFTINATNGSVTYSKDNIRGIFSAAGGSVDSRMFTINGTVVEPIDKNSPVVSGQQTSGEIAIRGANSNIIKTSEISELYLLAKDNTYKLSGTGNFITTEGNVSTKSYSSSGNTGVQTGNNNQSSLGGKRQYTYTSQNLVFEGKGWGHGVGMSQHGAKGMAEMGYSYVDILKHYYTGIEVR